MGARRRAYSPQGERKPFVWRTRKHHPRNLACEIDQIACRRGCEHRRVHGVYRRRHRFEHLWPLASRDDDCSDHRLDSVCRVYLNRSYSTGC